MIFTSEKVKIFRRRLKKQLLKGAPYGAESRRATNLLPAPQTVEDVLLKDASIHGYSNLLLSLEANQKSGCLIIQSDKNKSRSGILIFRGRILGCMYGQKNMKNYLFDNNAYERALRDLQSNKKTVDVYGLKDEIVVAAASLFHGPTFEEPDMLTNKFFDEVLGQLVETNVPGCIVITDKKDSSQFMVYIFAGKIVGIHCSKRGWLKPELANVYMHLNKNQNQRIRACILPCQNVVEVDQYSFSLSGLGDRNFAGVKSTDKFDVLNIFYLLRMDRERLANTPGLGNMIRIDKFLPNVNPRHYSFLNRLTSVGNYTVRP